MPVHKNSAGSYWRIDRAQKIAEVLRVYSSDPKRFFTDREVMAWLGYNDPNRVRPGITWALDDNRIYFCGEDRMDPETGRPVRQCKFNSDNRPKYIPPTQIEMEF